MTDKKPLLRSVVKRYGAGLLIAIGVVCLAIAILLYMQSRPVSVTKLPSAPGETAPKVAGPPRPNANSLASYTVPADDPRYIAIPAIGITNTEVVRLGLTTNSAIAAPRSSYVTGWYDNSAKPGGDGAMFIYGHVLGWNTGGIFYNLHNVIAGDKVLITSGDNKIYTYRVDAVKTYQANNVNMDAVLSSYKPNIPGLNLMTCAGQLNKSTIEFSERLVVFASLVNN